jgi:hypothetical protein
LCKRDNTNDYASEIRANKPDYDAGQGKQQAKGEEIIMLKKIYHVRYSAFLCSTDSGIYILMP